MKSLKDVIVLTALAAVVFSGGLGASATSGGNLENKIDSLFIIASSGEVRFRDQNEPAMDSIAALGAAAVPHLIDKFTTKSARERWTVIWILQRIGSEAVPDLVKALKRPDHLVVQRVCWALGDIKDTASVEPLIVVCDHDRWQVRDQAIGALGKIGDQRGAVTVTGALSDTIGQVRKSGAVAAGRLEIQQAARQLVQLLGDDFYGARWTAAASLLKLDTPTVVAVLRDSITSGNDLAGNLASWVLAQIGTDEAIEILLEQTLSSDVSRRANAAVALIEADPHDNCGYRELLLKLETDRLVRLKIESAIHAVDNGQQ